MQKGRFLGVAAVLAAITLGGLALLAPTAHGQAVWSTDHERGPERRIVRVVGGPGSEIGVTVRDVDEADVKREALAGQAGVAIDEVRAGSPAEKAGLKAGDVVTGFDGERVRGARQFARLVEETPAGRRVKLVVTRGGKPAELEVTPEASSGLMGGGPRAFTFHVDPDSAEIAREAEREARRGLDGLRAMPGFKWTPDGPGALDLDVFLRPGRLGVGVSDLTPELAAHFGAKGGVLVNSVTSESPAARAGVKVGDVITSVDGTAVEDGADLRRRVWKDEEATSLTLGLVRDKRELSVKVTLEAPGREPAARTRQRA